MRDLEKYNKDMLLDLLEEKRKQKTKKQQEMGKNQFMLYLLNKWKKTHPDGFYTEENGMLIGQVDDSELEEILEKWMNTYVDPDQERLKMLNKIIDSFETKISNARTSIKMANENINLIIEKIEEIDRAKSG